MEFNEKLQELRKQKNLTQEELAERLFVSRTAVSKWELGKGYPNIDTLKAISEFFNVTVDELLSGKEILNLAEQDAKQKQNHFKDLAFGFFDICAALFLFLPFFGQKVGDAVVEVSLLTFSGGQAYLKVIYLILVAVLVLFGIMSLALQNLKAKFWAAYKGTISIILSAFGVILFIVSMQPYAAIFLFMFFCIKVLMTLKV